MRSRISMEVYNPTGVVETVNSHAPRLDTLNGKTIGEVTEGMWEYDRMFPLIRRLLQERFSDVKFVPYSEFPIGIAQIDVEGLGEMAKEKGCDAVIVASAA